MVMDLALVADVLPDEVSAAKDLGVLNIAGGSYGVLYALAGACAIVGPSPSFG
jgi:hypothetical protein